MQAIADGLHLLMIGFMEADPYEARALFADLVIGCLRAVDTG